MCHWTPIVWHDVLYFLIWSRVIPVRSSKIASFTFVYLCVYINVYFVLSTVLTVGIFVCFVFEIAFEALRNGHCYPAIKSCLPHCSRLFFQNIAVFKFCVTIFSSGCNLLFDLCVCYFQGETTFRVPALVEKA